MILRKLIGFVYIFTLSMHCFAVQVTDLYSVSIAVVSQAVNVRSQTVPEGLKQVLIKTSGDSTIANVPQIKSALKHANDYLQAYTYQDHSNLEGNDQLLLHLNFEPMAINELLRDAQQTVWGENRPLVLVWTSLSSDKLSKTSSELLSQINNNNFVETQLSQIAKNRGLPILFPMLDLVDMQTLSDSGLSSNLWPPNIKALKQASSRYGSDGMLIVKLNSLPNGQWLSHWLLISQGNKTQWDEKAKSLPLLIEHGINETADTLAARYGTVNNNSANESIALTVLNIQSLENYAQVSAYLRHLTPVQDLEITQVKPNGLLYTLKVMGGKFALAQALSLDHRLQQIATTEATMSNNAEINNTKDLVYQWNS